MPQPQIHGCSLDEETVVFLNSLKHDTLYTLV